MGALSASLTSLANVPSREVGTRNLKFWNFPFPGKFKTGFRKCFYIGKDFSGTDIYHSDIKKYVSSALLFKNFFFFLIKNDFAKFEKIFKTKCL